MSDKGYIFEMNIDVRDYELDSEGIVNNANYLHYLEHTRHKFCSEAGMSFSRMREIGIDPVLARVQIDYMTPLRSGDSMRSCLSMCRRGPRFVFKQDIYNSNGDQAVRAEVTVVALKNGVLSRGDELAVAFEKYL